ncbi:MAG TPA: alpha-glucosidase [Hyphomicrobiales bacterium]|nr:alpha-glucosidase [Hyphomicrobiales bacterium]
MNAALAQTIEKTEVYSIGDFALRQVGRSLQVLQKSAPERVLWETDPSGEFLVAETAIADIKAFGTPEGAYEIVDKVSASYAHPTIEAIKVEGSRATVLGKLSDRRDSSSYSITFEALSSSHLRFAINAAGANRIRLLMASAPDEAFFGFGQQLTDFNQKGNFLPILVQEHGVGRGRPVVTQLIDVFANRGGGNPYITEAPAPHFISSRLRSLFLENTEYSTFDMRRATQVEIKVWSDTITGRILYGEAPLDLIEAYSEYCGRMRKLPEWVHNGVIVSVQGGTKVVREKLGELRKANIPLAGLWIQDWPGVRITSAGKQLWWDWKLDESYYPNWKELVDDLERHGERMLIYINPLLSTEEGHNALFTEAKNKGYLVQKTDGTPYLIKNTNFYAGLIDLTNPSARTWIKNVIKTEMIEKAHASGWMNDFGEALPFDSKLHGDANPAAWHNRYSEEWAKIAREAIEEAGRGDDIVFFDRSGFTRSPAAATLFWLGDQIQSWDRYDGIKTAVVGLLSGGISGFSLLHSDTGGYVVLSLDVAGKKVPIFARTPELFMRWIELNAFTAVFRTHEGLDPAASAQFDTNAQTLDHMRRFGNIYKGLALYRKQLVAEAAAKGHPVVRHLFLHYPNDPNTHGLKYQFLLGPDLMAAPVLDQGAESVEVYFPKGAEWLDLWSGAEVGRAGEWQRMPAPLSKPAVFLRKGAATAEIITNGLKSTGVL